MDMTKSKIEIPVGYMTLKDAGDELGESKTKMSRLVKGGALPTYSHPLDRRLKLVKKADVKKLRTPRPR
jgi:hypothetical protein